MSDRSTSPYDSPPEPPLPATPSTISRRARRGSIQCAYFNAALWGLGNGLVGSTLVIYLAYELGADAVVLGVSWILAFPKFVGLLRLSAPAMIDRVASRKSFCLAAYVASACVLACLPIVAAPGFLSTPRQSLWALVAIWSLYHLLEYLGTVALWSWLADLVPLAVRGRFIGYRQRWLVAGSLLGMLAAGGFSHWWKQSVVPVGGRLAFGIPAAAWVGYAIAAAVGALVLLIAVWPLARMVPLRMVAARDSVLPWRSLLAPLADARYWRLLVFGCALSFFNGLTQSIQFFYPAAVLGLALWMMLSLRSTTRLGQLWISPAMGRLADRFGNRPVMIACQLVVATGPAFYLLATPNAPWWIAGAWLAWIMYAGLNVCLPNLMIKLATPQQRAAYIATYFAITGVVYAVSTLVGGSLVESYRATTFTFGGFVEPWDIFDVMFLVGWIGRTASVLLLFWIIEPGAKPFWQFLDSQFSEAES